MTTLLRDERSTPFFNGTAAGELRLRRTPDGRFLGPDALSDPENPTAELEWVAASGHGTVVSWIVTRARPAADGTQAVVGVGALIELEEGPWIYAPLIDIDPSAIIAGMAVVARFPVVSSGEIAPAFAPA